MREEYLTFNVNQPVVVYIIHDAKLTSEPFWLESRQFQKTDLEVKLGRRVFDVYRKEFPAGKIGLGISTLACAGYPYFIAVSPQKSTDNLTISDVQPSDHTLGFLDVDQLAFCDGSDKISELPDELTGQAMIRGSFARRRETQIHNFYRFTDYPASEKPDHVVLTWSDDPKTTQTIRWRTSTAVSKGIVQYQKKSEYLSFKSHRPKKVTAVTDRLETPGTVNDPVI